MSRLSSIFKRIGKRSRKRIIMEKYSNVKNDFDEVLMYSQHLENVNTDKLFDKWLEKKQFFIDKFDGLILEYPEPIEIELEQENKIKKVHDFIYWISSNYETKIGCDRFLGFEKFIIDNKNNFFTNVVKEDFTHKDLDGTVIPKGMKLVKAFKYFVEDKENLIEIQNKASMIIQEDKIKGKLCFSVHPLDFLSSSENTYNWRSCHALDGEYRAGNLSYMLDDCTMMCYLKTEDQCKLPNFPENVPWNSKKWRMLLFISSDRKIMFAGRQYPYAANKILDIIRQKCIDLGLLDVEDSWWWNEKVSGWSNETISSFNFKDSNGNDYSAALNDKYLVDGEGLLVPLRRIIRDADGSKHYNDLLYSSIYKPFYCYVSTDYNPYPHTALDKDWLVIGGETYCIHCGKRLIDTEDSMLCYKCFEEVGEQYYYCDNCGDAIPHDEEIQLENGEYVCQNCFDRCVSQCDKCGGYDYNDYMNELEDGRYVCNSCYDEIKQDKEEE